MPTVLHWRRTTYPEVAALDRGSAVPILPVGAVEAHGPHLPTSTDRIIALGMAEEGGRRLAEHGFRGLILPPIDYTAAPFAAGFAGTLSIRPETLTALVADIADGLRRQGFRRLVLANAHLDPGHLESLYAAKRRAGRDGFPVLFPDVTRKPWALRLGEEFRSGACHAGRYEGSMVMALEPDLVREELRTALPPNPRSLSRAIREGLTTFEEAGGPEAYFGDPAAASAEEGLRLLRILGQILAENVVSELGPGR